MKTAIIKTFHTSNKYDVYFLEERESWHGTGHAPTYKLVGYEQFAHTTLIENGERTSVETWLKTDPEKVKE